MDRALVDWLPPAPPESDVRRLADLVGLTEPVQVVDVGANPIGDDPPYQGLLTAGVAEVTGFEPQPDALTRLQEAAGPQEHYLPHVIGDGTQHRLHVCRSTGFTSLLEPDPTQLALLTDFPALAEVTAVETVSTTRLDDVGLDRVDLLKMDVQGGELAVVEGGPALLGEAVAVQTEVGFHRLYHDAPTFAEVDLALRRHGLVPHSFVSTRTWPTAPVQWADPLEVVSRQLVEADVLYVADLTRPQDLSTDRLRRLAVVVGGGYGAVGVALRCLGELVARGAAAPDAVNAYRELATAWLTPTGHGNASAVSGSDAMRSRR